MSTETEVAKEELIEEQESEVLTEIADVVEQIEERIDELVENDSVIEDLEHQLEQIEKSPEANLSDAQFEKIHTKLQEMHDDIKALHVSSEKTVDGLDEVTEKPINEILDNPATTVVEALSEKKKSRYAGHVWK
jgi:hypothetical protein